MAEREQEGGLMPIAAGRAEVGRRSERGQIKSPSYVENTPTREVSTVQKQPQQPHTHH